MMEHRLREWLKSSFDRASADQVLELEAVIREIVGRQVAEFVLAHPSAGTILVRARVTGSLGPHVTA